VLGTVSVVGVIVDALVVIAALLWAGGLLVLGAIVAPTVFRTGTPNAADLMQTVFSRFDRVAIAAASVILIAEAASWLTRQPMARNDRIMRLVLVILLAACAGVQAGLLTPNLVRLFGQGARRGVGELGARFDRIHRASEWVGKASVFCALALAAFVVRSRGRGADDVDLDDDRTAD